MQACEVETATNMTNGEDRARHAVNSERKDIERKTSTSFSPSSVTYRSRLLVIGQYGGTNVDHKENCGHTESLSLYYTVVSSPITNNQRTSKSHIDLLQSLAYIHFREGQQPSLPASNPLPPLHSLYCEEDKWKFKRFVYGKIRLDISK